ncbi:hypothetical protein BJY16_001519 [Actinoplanes octamycinicus]|uniref:DUF6457 domain-containing protein n=1 Tax=Actinoplanes octamycinicus TaxID=135948 RepID=A0A7W7M5U3_9ACTN|nr:DUF6457 domain-containing protein [Actinoplanes octamycinicus]MBB4738060.1 hypothetical protein [Actinoplanes octamycinicus]GIE59387.1 hypothetical protein Aoc01nite_47890 [Actinoplanes octamycinicus]
MNELDRWIAAAGAKLGVPPEELAVSAVLDVTRDVAHNVLRPAAPLTSYLMGLAVGRGADPAEAAEKIGALARSWAKES